MGADCTNVENTFRQLENDTKRAKILCKRKRVPEKERSKTWGPGGGTERGDNDGSDGRAESIGG